MRWTVTRLPQDFAFAQRQPLRTVAGSRTPDAILGLCIFILGSRIAGGEAEGTWVSQDVAVALDLPSALDGAAILAFGNFIAMPAISSISESQDLQTYEQTSEQPVH